MSKTASAGKVESRTNGTTAARSGDEDEVLRRLEAAMRAAADGDFSRRLPARRKGLLGEAEAAFNRLADRSQAQTAELQRIARQIGREGRMTERARTEDASGDFLERVETSTD